MKRSEVKGPLETRSVIPRKGEPNGKARTHTFSIGLGRPLCEHVSTKALSTNDTADAHLKPPTCDRCRHLDPRVFATKEATSRIVGFASEHLARDGASEPT